MKKVIETGMIIAAALGFFGFIYPELCLIEDTCKIIRIEALTGLPTEASEEKAATAENTGADSGENSPAGIEQDILRELCNLPPEKIRIKSKLLEYVYEK